MLIKRVSLDVFKLSGENAFIRQALAVITAGNWNLGSLLAVDHLRDSRRDVSPQR